MGVGVCVCVRHFGTSSDYNAEQLYYDNIDFKHFYFFCVSFIYLSSFVVTLSVYVCFHQCLTELYLLFHKDVFKYHTGCVMMSPLDPLMSTSLSSVLFHRVSSVTRCCWKIGPVEEYYADVDIWNKYIFPYLSIYYIYKI